MMTKLASAVLALLISSNAAVARDFAKPPMAESRMALPLPMVNRADVEKALAARRDHNIAAFRAYMNAGVFPHNTVRPGPLNVWRDAEGHLCAAATMIDKDGKHQLVQKTAETNDFIRLLDVTTGPILDWMLTSGLTIEEIDRIQAPMVMPDNPEQDREWRAAADAALMSGYVETSTWLDSHRKEGLASAVDRLMAHPLLARKLVNGTV
jgi:hypothetical protein